MQNWTHTHRKPMATLLRTAWASGKSKKLLIHRLKWRHSNLWSRCDLYVVEQRGVLREVKWCRFVALFK